MHTLHSCPSGVLTKKWELQWFLLSGKHLGLFLRNCTIVPAVEQRLHTVASVVSIIRIFWPLHSSPELPTRIASFAINAYKDTRCDGFLFNFGVLKQSHSRTFGFMNEYPAGRNTSAKESIFAIYFHCYFLKLDKDYTFVLPGIIQDS